MTEYPRTFTPEPGQSCWYREYDHKARAWCKPRAAYWQAWAQDHEEFEGGPGSTPVAILIDRATVRGRSIYVEQVTFADEPNFED